MAGIESRDRWPLSVLGAFVLLSVLEYLLDRFLTGDRVSGALRRLALAVVPFLAAPLGFAWLDLSQWSPPPHLFALRQAQMVFGILWISHLLLFLSLTGRKAVASGKWRPAWVFGVLGLFLFGGTAAQTLRASSTGDEPHYLMVMESLVRDGDLDLQNNYDRQDWRRFHERSVLTPQDEEPLDERGRRISRHPVGVSILALPAYYLVGRSGVAAFLALTASAAVVFVLLALEAMGFARETVLRVGWVSLISSPLWMFSGNQFPETPAALGWAAALWAASRKRWAISGLLACSTLWLHPRNGFVLAGILAVGLGLCLFQPDTRSKAVRWAAGGVLPVAALAMFLWHLFGAWNPLVLYGPRIEGGFHARYFLTQVLGHLTDQESGLWIYYPVFLAIPAGVAAAYRTGPRRAFLLGGALSAALIGLGGYFYLGGPPPTRFLVSLTPFFLVAAAYAFRSVERHPRRLRVLAVLTAWGLCVTFPLVAIPWLRYSQSGEAWIWQLGRHLTGWPLPTLLPSFYLEPVPARSYALALLWVGVSVAMAAWFMSAEDVPGRKKT